MGDAGDKGLSWDLDGDFDFVRPNTTGRGAFPLDADIEKRLGDLGGNEQDSAMMLCSLLADNGML